MRIISTTDLSREGNDCYIHESISLVEQFGGYAVISFCKLNCSWGGWADNVEVSVLKYTVNAEEIKRAYKYYGGILDEAVLAD